MNEYQVYLDMVKEYLVGAKKRLLTEKEEEVVIAHLEAVALGFCNIGLTIHKELGITQVLAIETAKKVSEIHPDIPNPTPEQVDQRVAEVLAVQNFLAT